MIRIIYNNDKDDAIIYNNGKDDVIIYKNDKDDEDDKDDVII